MKKQEPHNTLRFRLFIFAAIAFGVTVHRFKRKIFNVEESS